VLVLLLANPGKPNFLKAIDVATGTQIDLSCDTPSASMKRVVMVEWATGEDKAEQWLSTLLFAERELK